MQKDHSSGGHIEAEAKTVVEESCASALFHFNGKQVQFRNPSWELIESWIPIAHLTVKGLDATIT